MFRLKLMSIGVLAAITLSGCGGGSEDPGQERAFSRVEATWTYTSFNENYVVSTPTQWREARQRNQSALFLEQPLADVNFESQMVLGLTRGTGLSGCYTLRITRVIERPDVLEVEYVQTVPQPNLGCGDSLTALTDFVVTAKSSKSVNFVQTGI